MILGITGSRCITDAELIETALNSTHQQTPIAKLVHGGAKGVDTIASTWATANGIEQEVIRPLYEQHGKYAPLLRNKEIIAKSDMVLAIWDGISKGTAYTINTAKEAGMTVRVIKRPDTQQLKLW
jgi:predicted Rossmann fold nucleotide-binding protein DprA/Smf involved in DNA uptake